jgi:hypothetical protein
MITAKNVLRDLWDFRAAKMLLSDINSSKRAGKSKGTGKRLDITFRRSLLCLLLELSFY